MIHRGKKDVLENYAKIFESCAEPKVVPVERYGTPERVFDDFEMTFKLIDGKGFPNHPLPVGTRIALRVVLQLPHSGRADYSRERLRDVAT